MLIFILKRTVNLLFGIIQDEHKKLTTQIDEILKLENEKSCKYDEINTKFAETDANFQKYKYISDDTIKNLKSQLEYQNTVRV